MLKWRQNLIRASFLKCTPRNNYSMKENYPTTSFEPALSVVEEMVESMQSIHL